ncbi:MAG: gamma-butyrobetaine hydroxylase-like domain-containing protein [Pseudomonadota bacterium]
MTGPPIIDRVWVTEIAVEADRCGLSVTFEKPLTDGRSTADLSAEYLRVESPSAEVQGHGPGQKKIIRDKQGVTISSIDPIGHYAVRIGFSDGHSSGLYTWETFRDLALEYTERWAAYQAATQA